MGVMRLRGELAYIDVPSAARRTPKQHRDRRKSGPFLVFIHVLPLHQQQRAVVQTPAWRNL